jgi:integrase
MAFTQCRQGSYRILFRYHGKQHAFTLGEVSSEEAEGKAAQVNYLLMRLKQRLAEVPPGMGIVEYLQFDGKRETPAPPKLTLGQLRDRQIETLTTALEANSLATIRIHFRHLTAQIGENYPINELTLADLQRYVDRRASTTRTNGRKLSAVTIKKELVTLGSAWSWGQKMKLISTPFPADGLRFPKTTEKPPFQTLAEIERQIEAGGLTPAEIDELYDSLYLQVHETADFLTFVKKNAAHGFIYPMFCTAAHTGARRSELIRMKITDIDLAGRIITIREKKRVRGQVTTRRVPMSAFLATVLTDWVANHPGGPWLFCHGGNIANSRTRSALTGYTSKNRPTSGKARNAALRLREAKQHAPLTADEANHHFRKTVANSKWNVLRGWHVARHSFISALASKNIDQRLVEEFAGHMTPATSKRYRHLWPSTKNQAIASVFDAA